MTTTLAGDIQPGLIRPGTWRAILTPGLDLLNSNQRLHRQRQAEYTRALRGAAYNAARRAAIPHLDAAYITCYLRPTDRRRRDPGNWYPSAKAAVDGLVDAGVLDDDDHTRLLGPDMRLGPVHKPEQLVLVVTDLAAVPAAHLALLNPAA